MNFHYYALLYPQSITPRKHAGYENEKTDPLTPVTSTGAGFTLSPRRGNCGIPTANGWGIKNHVITNDWKNHLNFIV